MLCEVMLDPPPHGEWSDHPCPITLRALRKDQKIKMAATEARKYLISMVRPVFEARIPVRSQPNVSLTP
jgi:hypothetical protein